MGLLANGASAQSVLRTHLGLDFEDHFGDSVGALGDLNGDGVRDYCVGAPAFFGVSFVKVYSGADGQELYELGGAGFVGRQVIGLDDVNADGVEDILSVGYDWDLSTFQIFVTAWSGADGAFLYQAPTNSYPLLADSYSARGVRLADVNGDGVDEFAISSMGLIDSGDVRSDLYVCDGASGIPLWQRETESDLELLSYRFPTMIADLDGDLQPDLRVLASWETMGGQIESGFAFLGSLSGDLVADSVAVQDRLVQAAAAPTHDYNMDGVLDPVVIGFLGLNESFIGVVSGQPSSEFLMAKPLQSAAFEFGPSFDHDGDGIVDYLVGAPSARNLLSGASFSRLWGLGQGTSVPGENVGMIGDVDQDGRSELLKLVFPPSHSGEVFVVSGAYQEFCDQLQIGSQNTNQARHGQSVSLRQTGAAVGASGENAEDGAAYLYDLTANGDWMEAERFEPLVAGLGARFGWDVALDGNLCVIGAPLDVDSNGAGVVRGAAYVVRRSNGNWFFDARLQPLSLTAGANFGLSVAISGDRIVVGAPTQESQGSTNVGAVFTFEYDNATWQQTDELSSTTPGGDIWFGTSVAIQGNWIGVGAPYEDAAFSNQGSAYLFERQANGQWALDQQLFAPSPAAQRFFGIAVDVDGGRLVVGEEYEDFLGMNAGAAHVYARNPMGTAWPLEQTLRASNGTAEDTFGNAVAISGERIVLSSRGYDDPVQDAGAAYLFEFDGNAGMWVESEILISSMPQPMEVFGNDVDVFGTSVLVGAIGTDGPGPLGGVGRAYFLDASGQDCNGNGISDVCDVKSGFSLDCNGNLIPDECEQAQGFETDCNSNLINDACEIADGSVTDCNVNGVPDECDIALGVLEDCDSNGIADLCELLDGSGSDFNGNATLDACESIGSPYCTPGAPNSVSAGGGLLRGIGSGSVGGLDTFCVAENLPPMQSALLLSSTTQDMVPFPGGSDGVLCLGGMIGRHNDALTMSDGSGTAHFGIDPGSMPTPHAPTVILAGTDYHFQVWYRDPVVAGFDQQLHRGVDHFLPIGAEGNGSVAFV